MRILCFGDSNTYGYDPRGYFGGRYGAEDRWVDLLAKRTGWECINEGANGREIPQRRFVSQLFSDHAPADIFLLMLGTNDLFPVFGVIVTTGHNDADLLLPTRAYFHKATINLHGDRA